MGSFLDCFRKRENPIVSRNCDDDTCFSSCCYTTNIISPKLENYKLYQNEAFKAHSRYGRDQIR